MVNILIKNLVKYLDRQRIFRIEIAAGLHGYFSTTNKYLNIEYTFVFKKRVIFANKMYFWRTEC